jgi:hypothetical protein
VMSDSQALPKSTKPTPVAPKPIEAFGMPAMDCALTFVHAYIPKPHSFSGNHQL